MLNTIRQAAQRSYRPLRHTVHGLAGDILLIRVILHIVGALKHHIIDKDATLKRMLGGQVSSD